jgi:predicted AlkP superfamily pyrophosphatase or phosphodiesterase
MFPFWLPDRESAEVLIWERGPRWLISVRRWRKTLESQLIMVRASLLLFLLSLTAWARPLLVISIDGLDHRYLRDADKLRLKIPNLRRMVAEGTWADGGVIGVFPTVTFPSHTSMVTGVLPPQHGLIDNNIPAGERYFFASYLKVPTLWDVAHEAGLKTGTVYWPVTVGSKTITWDFPEYFKKRQGAGMDWESAAAKATPGLIEKMIARFPSMPQEWVDDRIRTLATIYLLKYEKPDLVLVHLVDHDSEAHHTGPFTIHAKAVLEHQDELLGQILEAKPREMAVALVSDHGFERVDEIVNLAAVLKANNIAGEASSYGTLVTTNDAPVAEYLRKSDLAREIPIKEWKRFQPNLPVPLAVFQARSHLQFAWKPDAPERVKPTDPGAHGYWPIRNDYRSTFLLWGPGTNRGRIGEIDMLSIAGRLSSVLGISFGKEAR